MTFNYFYTVTQAGEREDSLSSILASNARLVRMAQGLSVVRLSRLSGISRQLLMDIEQGKADIRLSYLKRLSDALCVDPEQLIAPNAQCKRNGPED